MIIGGLFTIIVSSIFINNIIFAKFLGCCPFMGVSKKIDSSLGMGMAVTFVITIASGITWLVYTLILKPLGLEYLQTIAFILIIASLVQFVEMAIQKTSPSLYKALGVGFSLALLLLAGIREKLEYANIPKNFKGVPIAFVTAGLLAMAFMGFSGMQI